MKRKCDVCDETGDETCFTGSGICAIENAMTMATVDAIRERDMVDATAYAMTTNGDMIPCPDDTYATCNQCENVDVCVTSGIIELCDYCDNPATDTCPLCDATICNDHMAHDHVLGDMI